MYVNTCIYVCTYICIYTRTLINPPKNPQIFTEPFGGWDDEEQESQTHTHTQKETHLLPALPGAVNGTATHCNTLQHTATHC